VRAQRLLTDNAVAKRDFDRAQNAAWEAAANKYQEGAVDFLDVIDADRTVLQAQRAAVQLAGLQAVSTVSLIRAWGLVNRAFAGEYK
jgi:outer membrane protein, multidrug efflux system